MQLKTISMLWLTAMLSWTAQARNIRVTRVTDKVAVFRVEEVSNASITAIATPEGLIVVDTEISPNTMEMVKTKMKETFPGKDFLYAVNTHAHAYHAGGNAVFNDIPVIQIRL